MSERREEERQDEDGGGDKTQRMEKGRREADAPAPADEPWPVEEQASTETRAKESQIAIDEGALADDAATKSAVDIGENVSLMKSLGLADDARTKAAADEARRSRCEKRAEQPPACSTLESIDLVNGLMDRERRTEQESGVVDLSAKRKYGAWLVGLKSQLAAQQAAFKRDTGRAFDRKRDCVAQPVVNQLHVDASETKSNEPERARNSACTTSTLIEVYNGQMKRHRAIERESGVEDLDAKRKIGEALVVAKGVQAKALADFKRLWKRSFKRATDCATSP